MCFLTSKRTFDSQRMKYAIILPGEQRNNAQYSAATVEKFNGCGSSLQRVGIELQPFFVFNIELCQVALA